MDISKIDSLTIESLVDNSSSVLKSTNDDDFARRLEAAVKNNDDKELKKACQEFEAIMLDMLYKQMKATVIKSSLTEKDPGRDIFESMLDEELMQAASKTGSLGLAESLYKQLSKQYGRRVYAAADNNTAADKKIENSEISGEQAD